MPEEIFIVNREPTGVTVNQVSVTGLTVPLEHFVSPGRLGSTRLYPALEQIRAEHTGPCITKAMIMFLQRPQSDLSPCLHRMPHECLGDHCRRLVTGTISCIAVGCKSLQHCPSKAMAEIPHTDPLLVCPTSMHRKQQHLAFVL